MLSHANLKTGQFYWYDFHKTKINVFINLELSTFALYTQFVYTAQLCIQFTYLKHILLLCNALLTIYTYVQDMMERVYAFVKVQPISNITVSIMPQNCS